MTNPKTPWPLALARLVALGVLIAGGLLERRALARSEAERSRRSGRWARRVLRVLAIRCELQGRFASGPVLVVANHVSWLDVIVLLALAPQLRFVAKSDVQRWPLVGPLAAGAGTLFIERGSARAAHAMVATLAARLQAGDGIAVFPEGTTSTGETVGLLAPALFEAACRAGCAVQPVALRHDDGADGRSAAYVDDDGFVASLWRLCRARGVVCRVHVLPAEDARGAERRALAGRVQRRLQAGLTSLSGAPASSGSSAAVRA